MISLDGKWKASRNDMAGSGSGCSGKSNEPGHKFALTRRYVTSGSVKRMQLQLFLSAAKPDALRHTRRLARQGMP
ncbi:hypothetical protein XFF6991_420307 [Xanthomonas phaseoli pv. phaseoli]|uniref:Uncharacterized protein n=1 Tax=Xanthomonas campestris pv. phaseoli TaxID=317013 RepID=A0A7Z7J0L6_XANCH|nr:hypothetical protein XFF6991_420307 [Xanthomonas phaseoli pv. phaseoli]